MIEFLQAGAVWKYAIVGLGMFCAGFVFGLAWAGQDRDEPIGWDD